MLDTGCRFVCCFHPSFCYWSCARFLQPCNRRHSSRHLEIGKTHRFQVRCTSPASCRFPARSEPDQKTHSAQQTLTPQFQFVSPGGRCNGRPQAASSAVTERTGPNRSPRSLLRSTAELLDYRVRSDRIVPTGFAGSAGPVCVVEQTAVCVEAHR